MLKLIVNIIIATLISTLILGSSGLSVNTHYCPESGFRSISFFVKEQCEDEHKSKAEKNSCCSEGTIFTMAESDADSYCDVVLKNNCCVEVEKDLNMTFAISLSHNDTFDFVVDYNVSYFKEIERKYSPDLNKHYRSFLAEVVSLPARAIIQFILTSSLDKNDDNTLF